MNYKKILVAFLTMLFFSMWSGVLAQDSIDWASPMNLSRSGASTAPQMVLDSNGLFHVLWEDEIDGFVYSTGGPNGWSGPRVVELPFFTRRNYTELPERAPTPRFTPRLVADQHGSIHALWIDNVSSPNGTLYHSVVSANSFSQYDAWSVPQALEDGAAGPTAAVSASDLHLVYARRLDTPERPAGIYYQRLSLSGGNWAGGHMLYQSRYLRGLSTDLVNISIAALTDGRLFAAWEDVGREMIFVSQSDDNGGSWGAPLEVDRRSIDDASDAVGPSGVTVGGLGAQAVLTWSAGHQSGLSCTQYYRALADDGTSWSLPQIVPGLNGCLSSAQFFNDDTSLYLFGTILQPGAQPNTPTSTYLIAWDGMRWSDPQLQGDLAGLRNPETNQTIALSCLDVEGRFNQVNVVGCDLGVGGDIWWTTRSLGDSSEWFPPPSLWQGPDTIATAQEPVVAVQMLTDDSGGSHAFWFEPGLPQIFHSRWDGTTWSSATPVITTADEKIEEIAVAGRGGRLFMVYSDSKGLQFAQADVDRPTEWSTPLMLTSDQPDARYPSVLLTRGGELLVTYAVVLNEPRGVYLLRSTNLGESWSAPAWIFGGAAAGWAAVGQPRLTETTTGRLHALWSQRALPPENTQLGAVYSFSDDGGMTWSSPNSVINSPITWASLQGLGERVVNLLWAEVTNQRVVLWHSRSADNGATWAGKSQVGSLGLGDFPASTFDPSGQLHLLGLDDGRLLSWTFDGANWQAAEPFAVNLPDGGQLDAVVDTAGRLVTVYGPAMPGTADGQETDALFGMVRPLDIPAEALPTPPPPPPTATPEPTAAPTGTPEPTPTVIVPTAPDENPLAAVPGANSRVGQLALAAIPAALVVLVVVAIALRAVRMGRK